MDYAKAAGTKPKTSTRSSSKHRSHGRNLNTEVKLSDSHCKLQRHFPRPGLIDFKTDEEKKKEIKEKLAKSESPFTWNANSATKTSIPRLLEKDNEIKDNKKFKWRNFVVQLVTSYEYFKENQLERALEKIEHLWSTLRSLEEHCHEWLFLGIKQALEHVICASKAFLLFEMGRIKEAGEFIQLALPVDAMSRAGRGGIHGIKAAVFMEYGHIGNVKALDEIRKALEVDKSTAEWYFIKGKCMGRIRRVTQCHGPVSKEEVGAFAHALAKDKDHPEYKVHLAQALREQAMREYKTTYPKTGTDEFKKLRNKFWAVGHRYKEAVDSRPDCPHILTRCAFGLMKLPLSMVDLKLVKDWIDKALELAPENPMTHHVKGQFYDRFHTELEVAHASYKKAADLGNFGAAMDLVKMHHLMNTTSNIHGRYNIIQELKSVAMSVQEPIKKQVAYAQLGSYHLFIKKDLIEALKCYTEVVELDCESYALKSHKPMFIRVKDPVNMFEVLLEELDCRTEWNSFSKENAKILRGFRIKLMDHDTNKKRNEEKERLSVEKILQMAIRQSEKDKKFRDKRGKLIGRKKKWTEKKKKNDEKISKGKTKENLPENRIEKDKKFDQNCLAERHKDVFSAEAIKNVGEKNPEVQDPFFRRDSSMSHKFSMGRSLFEPEGRQSSRESSISSAYSTDEERYTMCYRKEKVPHMSRSPSNSKSHYSQSLLTTENLEAHSLANSNIGTRRVSLMSLSGTSCASDESLSVMDRVKQSYRKLSYKDDQIPTDHKSSGSKNANRKKNKKKLENYSEQNTSTVRTNIQRSESSQSLNFQHTLPYRNRFDKYKSSGCSSRDSSVESTRSLSFLPSFASKKTDSDA